MKKGTNLNLSFNSNILKEKGLLSSIPTKSFGKYKSFIISLLVILFMFCTFFLPSQFIYAVSSPVRNMGRLYPASLVDEEAMMQELEDSNMNILIFLHLNGLQL
jgi:hypothetical protein